VSCGVQHIAGIIRYSSVFLKKPMGVGETASPDYYRVIWGFMEKGHNFGHMRAEIRAQI
jgi:hypothetical protein